MSEEISFKVGDIVEFGGMRGVVSNVTDTYYYSIKCNFSENDTSVTFLCYGKLAHLNKISLLKLIKRPKILENKMNKEIKFKVGDIVEFGGMRGVVSNVTEDDFYPTKCDFETGTSSTFTCDGKLAHFHKEPLLKLIERPQEKTAYYKWRLYFKNGEIIEPAYFLDESLIAGDSEAYYKRDKVIKQEKISEAVYKIEGQE